MSNETRKVCTGQVKTERNGPGVRGVLIIKDGPCFRAVLMDVTCIEEGEEGCFHISIRVRD